MHNDGLGEIMLVYSMDDLRAKLQDRNIIVVAEKTGIHKMTLYNLMNKKGDVSFRVYEILVNYLFGDK
jgi:hypothetical protein